jgi:4-hydroxy-tetrahydrodipicolinate synthase
MTSAVSIDLRGLWVPIVTPFDVDGDVDVRSLEQLAHRLLSDGATGLVALGTTGEPATLTATERRLVVEICDRACRDAGRALIVGAGTNSTRRTIEEIEYLAAGTSAIAALIVVPYYTRPSEQAIVEHFTTVADASSVPVVAYNVPYRTGRALSSAALLEIGAHPRIVGLKQAVGALDLDTLEVLADAGPDFQVLAGDDAFIAPTMLMGGIGAISATAHLCTPLFVEMIERACAGDHDRAQHIGTALLPLITVGFSEPSPAAWKGALARQQQISTDELRRPMTPASPATVEQLIGAADRLTRQFACSELAGLGSGERRANR